MGGSAHAEAYAGITPPQPARRRRRGDRAARTAGQGAGTGRQEKALRRDAERDLLERLVSEFLRSYIPEFEEATGAKVNYETPSFPIYNQRMDIELSTKSGAHDVINVTFIYSGRWIGAGWVTPLNDFIDDPKKTPADWDANDFLPGTDRGVQGPARAGLRDPVDRRRADGRRRRATI